MDTIHDKQSADNLITDFLNGELESGDFSELLNWIKLDKANKKYFDECCEIWVTTRSSLGGTGYNVQEGFWKLKQKINLIEDQRSGTNKTSLFKTIIRYAAIFVIAFAMSGFLFYYLGKKLAGSPGQGISELVIPMGSRAKFLLSDGTEVTLNAGSTLKYNNSFGINDRVVQLEGEGYFKVSKEPEKPFIVKTPYVSVTALGTEFNVKAYLVDKTVETTLVNGLIKVEHLNSGGSNEITVLEPNQKLTFYKEDSKFVDETPKQNEKTRIDIKQAKVPTPIPVKRLVKESVNVEPVVSWKENRWIFENQSLSQIAIDLERKFDVQINFESEHLKTYRFTGTIIAEPIEQVLEVMSISAPINFKLKGRVITLSENKNFKELSKNLYNQHN
jgi:transmembrane sensor